MQASAADGFWVGLNSNPDVAYSRGEREVKRLSSRFTSDILKELRTSIEGA